MRQIFPALHKPVHTFKAGGFHPRVANPLEGKPAGIEHIDTLPKIEIPLLQHIGPVAKPIVDIGERVQRNQLIAQTGKLVGGELKQGFLYSRIHAPMDGIVTVLESRTLANGMKAQVVTIEREALETNGVNPQSGDKQETRAWRGKGYKEILERIALAGIVGQGGATFPTDIKLRLPINRRCDYLLLNAAECEPYLHSDASLLEERAFDVIGGIDVLAEGLRPKHVVIGLEQNKSYLLPRLRQTIQRYREYLKRTEGSGELLPRLRIAMLRTRYPQGAERQLVATISGREVPPGKLPLEVGCVVVNVATGKAIFDAVQLGLPLTRRIVTISGGAVARPKVFDAPIGSPVSELLELCGGLSKPVARMMNGGPMMGAAFYDLRQFVTKGSSGFLFLTAEEVGHKKQRPCIHCDACIRVCPMGLEPTAMYKDVLAENLADAMRIGLMNCIECGACSSSCPSQIPLTQGFRMGKTRWRQLQQKQPGK